MGSPQWVASSRTRCLQFRGVAPGSLGLTSCLECQAGAEEEMGHPRRSPASLPHVTSDLLINGPGGFQYTGLGSKRRFPLLFLNRELHSHACSKPAGVGMKWGGGSVKERLGSSGAGASAVTADPRLHPKPSLPSTSSI